MSRMENQKADSSDLAKLTIGPITSTIVKLSLPMTVAMAAMVCFNIVDTFFVSRLGTKQLAAMGFTFPIVLTVNSVALGLGTGATAVLSVLIGKGDREGARRITSDTILLSVTIVVFLLLVGLISIKELFTALGAKTDVLVHIEAYMRIWYIGAGFVVVPMVGNSAIRATGDTKTPSLIMLTSMLINAGLDPLLIFGIGPFPRLEIAGAALATVIARGISCLLALMVLSRKYNLLSMPSMRMTEVIHSWWMILHIGLATMISRVATPIAMGLVTRLVAGFGREAVAGFGVATRVEGLALSVLQALAMVVAPFVGQNLGARRWERMRRGISASIKISLGWGALILVLLLISGNGVARIFSKEASVISVARDYLGIVAIGYGCWGLINILVGVLGVLRRPFTGAAFAVGHLFLLYYPFARIGCSIWNLRGAFSGMVLSNLLAAIVGYYMLRYFLAKEEKKTLAEE
ncbi:MAG: MATE family efflux transporter [bacterium]